MNAIVKKLDSGIGYAFKRVVSPIAYCALTIRAGTRDEADGSNGVAHLTEHMLFKGTKSKGARKINNLLECVGGELNAYTTKEETVIHATVLKEDISKAVELLYDLAFNSIYPERELSKEQEIILEEIDSYKDTPSEQIFEDFDRYIFGLHPLAKPILGTPRSVKKLTVSDVKEFVGKNYIPVNMNFSIVADISPDRGAALVNRYFNVALSNNSSYMGKNCDLVVLPCQNGFIKKIPKKTHQAHCVMGSVAYSYYDERRLPLALLANILGGPAPNSKLNQVLRERYALVYTVDACYTPYSDTGLFTIYFGTDKESLDKSLDILRKELAVFINADIPEKKLKAAKKQLMGQMAIANDNAEGQCLSMGKSLLMFGEVESMDCVSEKIRAIKSGDIRLVAEDILSQKKMFTLIYN